MAYSSSLSKFLIASFEQVFLARQYEVQERLCVTPGVGGVGVGVGVGGGVDT